MTAPAPLGIEAVGHNPARLWGLTSEERLRRIGAKLGLEPGGEMPRILANSGFVFDGSWLKWAAERPGHVVTREGEPVLAHCVDEASANEVRTAMIQHRPLAASRALVAVAQETFGEQHDRQLRKREQPFVERLTADRAPAIERRTYYAAYKGVTDLLTKYLWPEWALHLTRLAARLGLSPNAVTFIGACFCVAAGVAFYTGDYWPGMAAALVFMVLDTVDGKLARCTITSSRIGDVLDHGIDLVHPLIWWWAWGVGLAAYGRPLDPHLFWTAMAALVGGYVVQRAVEGLFILWFQIHIHVWERLDTRFRLVTARRNPNMVLLFASLLIGRPDIGLLAVAAWTILSCLFHIVRIAQARLDRRRAPVTSWLERQ
jgi:phosphatidylglycerophosphate synthase